MGEEFSIGADESLPDGVRRVLTGRVDAALDGLAPENDRPVSTTVHEVRKRLKELRAGLRLVRPALAGETFTSENAGLRDVAKPLSDARDAEVMLDALASLQKHYRKEVAPNAFASVRRLLTSRREQIVAARVESADALESAASHLRAVKERLDEWGLEDAHWPAVREGLAVCYQDGRRAMRRALDHKQDDALHAWRKRAKDLRYQLTILQPLWPEVLRPLADEAHALGNALGDDHDLAVLTALLGNELHDAPAAERQKLKELILRRRTSLQERAGRIGGRLYAERAKRFIARMQVYWHVRQRDGT